MTVTWCVEPFPEFLEEAEPLFPHHWEELALDKDKFPLSPQYNVYLERDRRGEVLVVAGRKEGALVGYFVGFVAPGLHYQTCLTLTMDIFWVRQDCRGRQGLKLFKAVETEAARRGVQRMFVGSKMHKDSAWLFEKLGYTEVERYFSKVFV